MILYCGVPFANEAVAAQPTNGDCGQCVSSDASPCVRTFAYALPSSSSPTAPQVNYPPADGLGLLAIPCEIFTEIV